MLGVLPSVTDNFISRFPVGDYNTVAFRVKHSDNIRVPPRRFSA